MAGLVPVDHDPFAPDAQPGPSMVPVDHDPFPDQLIPPPRNLAAPAPWAENAVRGVAGKLADMVTFPGRAMQQGITTEEAVPWATDMGVGMVGAPGTPAGAVGSGVGKGIRAYHGSPHDFDRFDLSKIGTGEGAQSYGHGLYFAENEGVARNYRDALKWKGSDWDNPQFVASFWKDKFGGDAARAINHLTGAADSQTTPASRAAVRSAIDMLREGAPLTGSTNPGRMYEVNINAAPEQFLDWDKPLSRQSPQVQGGLEPFGFKAQPEEMKAFDDALLAALGDKGPSVLPKQPRDPAGEQIYSDLINQTGMNAGRARAVQADRSAMLREAGIPGIKYLDQGSRTSGDAAGMIANYGSRAKALEIARARLASSHFTDRRAWENTVKQLETPETSNYVLFDDKLIDIVRKYGIAGLAALPPAVAAEYRKQLIPVDHDPFAE